MTNLTHPPPHAKKSISPCCRTGLGFICFVIINPCVLLANRVDFGLFFSKISKFPPPPQIPPPPAEPVAIAIPSEASPIHQEA